MKVVNIGSECVNMQKNGKHVYKRVVWIVFHSLGVSCVGGVFFAYFLMFFDILTQGIFRAIEPNLVVALVEVAIGCFGLVYFWFVLGRKKVFRRKKVGDV